MTPWTTATEVKRYALVKWDSLNYATSPPAPFANEAAFNSFLADTLIPRAQDHINRYCKRDFDTDNPAGIPDAVKDVAARATANMIQYLVMNKMGPLIRTGDFTISIPTQAVLSKELKDLLASWVRRAGHVKATPYKTDTIKETWDET
ncbi:hypothetical protein MUP07_03595 [Candidatus Bathyarchaeota archaeon]|nr:hypothetical protein [Candidatus Bathyarchaeota archaeon]